MNSTLGNGTGGVAPPMNSTLGNGTGGVLPSGCDSGDEIAERYVVHYSVSVYCSTPIDL
jgi:hypothetical protein